MADESTAEITLLLQRWQAGDRTAEEKLWPVVYRELRALASSALRHGRRSQALQTTEVVHEACLRLLGRTDLVWPHRGHFFAFAATVMRRILVDHARKCRATKREGVIVDAPPERIDDPGADQAADVLAIDEALTRLTEIHPRYGKLVELRFFGGMSVDEAAEVLEISKATAIRDWRTARAWLYGELKSSGG